MLGGLQRGEGITAQRLVESPFIVGEIHFDNLFRARGEFRKDFTFGAAQDEGPDKRAQGLPGGGLAFRNGVFLRGRRGCGGKPFLERLPRTEQAGIDQVEQAPKILKAVFDGRARERHAEGCRNLAAGPGAAGVGVLERLRFIENGHLPLAPGEAFGFRMQQPVACDEHVAGAEGPHQCGPVAGAETVHRERGREAVEFVFPVVADGCGRNDDRRPHLGLRQQHGDGLHGLAEPHIVRKTGPRAPAGQPGHPDIAVKLVVAQLRPQRRRHGGRTAGQPDAAKPAFPCGVALDLRPVKQIAHRIRRQRMHPEACAVAFSQPFQPIKLLPELLGQGEERAVPKGYKTAFRLREAFQHLRHIQHQRLVDRDLPVQLEPVA